VFLGVYSGVIINADSTENSYNNYSVNTKMDYK